MTNDNSSSFFLMLILLALWSGNDNLHESYSADWMTCGKPSAGGTKCDWSDVGGTYKITLMRAANACAISYSDKGLSPFLSTGHLTFIDKGEWQCSSDDGIQGIRRLAKMTDGTLAIGPVSPLGGIMFDEAIEQNNGVVGTLLHWVRASVGISCSQRFLKVRLCGN
jgi:hypothetical protein